MDIGQQRRTFTWPRGDAQIFFLSMRSGEEEKKSEEGQVVADGKPIQPKPEKAHGKRKKQGDHEVTGIKGMNEMDEENE